MNKTSAGQQDDKRDGSVLSNGSCSGTKGQHPDTKYEELPDYLPDQMFQSDDSCSSSEITNALVELDLIYKNGSTETQIETNVPETGDHSSPAQVTFAGRPIEKDNFSSPSIFEVSSPLARNPDISGADCGNVERANIPANNADARHDRTEAFHSSRLEHHPEKRKSLPDNSLRDVNSNSSQPLHLQPHLNAHMRLLPDSDSCSDRSNNHRGRPNPLVSRHIEVTDGQRSARKGSRVKYFHSGIVDPGAKTRHPQCRQTTATKSEYATLRCDNSMRNAHSQQPQDLHLKAPPSTVPFHTTNRAKGEDQSMVTAFQAEAPPSDNPVFNHMFATAPEPIAHNSGSNVSLICDSVANTDPGASIATDTATVLQRQHLSHGNMQCAAAIPGGCQGTERKLIIRQKGHNTEQKAKAEASHVSVVGVARATRPRRTKAATAAAGAVAGVCPKQIAKTNKQSCGAVPNRRDVRSNAERRFSVAKGDKKVYVEPRDLDVLFGRGGKANNHSGNKAYRKQVEKLKERYKNSPKHEKTSISRNLVEHILAYNGRFIDFDEEKAKWYVVPNDVAQRKVSQALREDNTPESRAEKRRKYPQQPKQNKRSKK